MAASGPAQEEQQPLPRFGGGMTRFRMRVLVVGATGSIGRLVVEEAIRAGHPVRALVRDATRRWR